MEPIPRRAAIVCSIVVGLSVAGAAQAADRSLEDLLPADATSVIAAEVAAFTDVEALREVLDALTSIGGGSDPLDRLEPFGIDVEKDVDTLYLATVGTGQGDVGTVVLARGRLDAARVILARDPRFTRSEQGGHPVFRDRAGRTVALVDDVVVVGAVATVLDRASSGSGSSVVPALLDEVDPAFAVRIAHVLSDSDRRANPLLTTIESVRGGIDVDSGLRLHLDVRSQDANGSRLLSQVVRATAEAYTRTPAMQEVGLAPVFERVRVEDREREFTIGLDLDADEFAALRRALARLMDADD